MIAAPTLIHFGANPIAAHMFVFYSALLSAITPPVALAAYAAAAIAGANVMKTGWHACRLGFITFIVPYMFIYNTALLGMGSPLFVGWSFITAAFGTVAVATGLSGYLFTHIVIWRRPLYLIAGILCLIPETYTDTIGLILASILIWVNYKKKKQEGKSLPTA